MNARAARQVLLAQHARLRAQLQTCSQLARLYKLRHSASGELDLALELLRDELALHCDAEAALFRRLLHESSPWSPVLIDRMMSEHVAEHTAFCALLAGTRAEVVGRIDDLAAELDAQMQAEERTFLAPAARAP